MQTRAACAALSDPMFCTRSISGTGDVQMGDQQLTCKWNDHSNRSRMRSPMTITTLTVPIVLSAFHGRHLRHA